MRQRGTWAVVAVVALAATSCALIRPGGALNPVAITVGPPTAHGDRVVHVTDSRLAAGAAATVEVRVDRVNGAPVAVDTEAPFDVTVPGASLPAGRHTLFASVRSGGHRALGATSVSGSLRFNQMQVLASHNSYHIAPADPPESLVLAWQYTHDPLDVQFESEGIRQIELDVWANPNGIEVFHIADFDDATTCSLLVTCLNTVKAWSDAHPRHMPIAIQLEIEDEQYPLVTKVALPFDAAAFDQLDAEIRSVFPERDLITPDDVRGRHATLAEAVTTDGWPTIDSVRGQVMFVMDNGDFHREIYAAGRPSLEGRVIFTNSEVGRPDAAFIKLNDPIGDATRIHDAVTAGYLVRTRADGDGDEARDNNTTQRDAAIASGAQWVSTDFEVPGRAPGGSPYFAVMPGGTPARCNPLNAPGWCTSSMIESLGG